MRGIAGKMEEHHNVRILDEAIVGMRKALSIDTSPAVRLPDKSVSVLDTACAKVAIGQGATPASVEDAAGGYRTLQSEIDALDASR